MVDVVARAAREIFKDFRFLGTKIGENRCPQGPQNNTWLKEVLTCINSAEKEC